MANEKKTLGAIKGLDNNTKCTANDSVTDINVETDLKACISQRRRES